MSPFNRENVHTPLLLTPTAGFATLVPFRGQKLRKVGAQRRGGTTSRWGEGNWGRWHQNSAETAHPLPPPPLPARRRFLDFACSTRLQQTIEASRTDRKLPAVNSRQKESGLWAACPLPPRLPCRSFFKDSSSFYASAFLLSLPSLSPAPFLLSPFMTQTAQMGRACS